MALVITVAQQKGGAGKTTLATVLGNRAAFASSFALGSSVLEAAPRSAAAAEMTALAAEITMLTG